MILLQSDIFIEDLQQDFADSDYDTFQLRYVRVYFHVFGKENNDTNEIEHFFTNLNASKTDLIEKIRAEMFKSDLAQKPTTNYSKNPLRKLRLLKMYNHIQDVDKTNAIDEQTFFKYLKRAKSELGNDCRELFMNFIENYEIFNRIYDEFNDEEEDLEEDLLEEQTELENEPTQGETLDQEETYLDVEQEKETDEFIKVELVKKLESLKNSIFKQKVCYS